MRGALVVLSAMLTVLSGCGGDPSEGGPPGDDSDAQSGEDTSIPETPLDPPEAPVLQVDVSAIKRFLFDWADVERETEYRLLEKLDGDSEHLEISTLAANTTSHELEVFLPTRIGASYVLEACNEAGCTRSDEVVAAGHLVEAIGYVKASNTGAGDHFGRSVALSSDGSTLAIGAWHEDSAAKGIDGDQANDSASDSGAVYVFTRDEAGRWSQEAYLKASNTGADDRFGGSLALSADGATLAVGAHGESSAATGIDGNQNDNSRMYSGAVYVFARTAGTWSQQAYIKASNTDGGDNFGGSVALSADGITLAVGAQAENGGSTGIDGNQSGNSCIICGAVYVFIRDGDAWTQQAYIKASNTGEGDSFGRSVALSSDGTTLAVGAWQEDSGATGIDGDQSDNSIIDSGAVYVFTRSAGAWSQQAYIKASNTDIRDRFGAFVALSSDGSTLAVGAPFEDSVATGSDGNQGDNSAPDCGAVYVFTRNAGVWSHQAYLKASNTNAGDNFGTSLSLSEDGDVLAVGAPLEGSAAMGIAGDQNDNSAEASGAVYLFTRTGGAWSQQAYVKASNSQMGARHGSSVALSGDASTLAVGAQGENSAATGVGGDQTDRSSEAGGAAYLY